MSLLINKKRHVPVPSKHSQIADQAATNKSSLVTKQAEINLQFAKELNAEMEMMFQPG